MRKSRVAVMLTGAALAIGLAVATAMPASASWPYTYRYGGNNCGGTVHPTLWSVNTGNLVHQISPGVGYYEATYHNGSVQQARRTAIGEHSATWATIGYDTYMYDMNWYCS